jgi:hypothetical protein
MVIPANALTGLYKLNVTTVNGGFATSAVTFTVTGGKPTVATLTPITGNRNATVSFTVTGTNFQIGSNTTYVRFLNATSGVLMNTSLPEVYNVTPTMFDARMVIPGTALTGVYKLNVTTVNGGFATSAATFTVTGGKPTVATLTPITGNRNATVSFTVTGTNFQDGINTTYVRFLNATSGAQLNVTAPEVYNITPTKFDARMVIPGTALTGLYKLNVSTVNGGFATSAATFTVASGKPTVTVLAPVTGYRNTTLDFTVTGTNFQDGINTTYVRFLNATSGAPLNATAPQLFNITPTKFDARMVIPGNALNGVYKLNVSTVNGGFATSASTMTVSKLPAPTLTSFIPSTGYRSTTVSFTIIGTNFEIDKTSVNLTRTGSTELASTVTVVNPTLIQGTVNIPSNALAGLWNVNLTTQDGGRGIRANAINII